MSGHAGNIRTDLLTNLLDCSDCGSQARLLCTVQGLVTDSPGRAFSNCWSLCCSGVRWMADWLLLLQGCQTIKHTPYVKCLLLPSACSSACCTCDSRPRPKKAWHGFVDATNGMGPDQHGDGADKAAGACSAAAPTQLPGSCPAAAHQTTCNPAQGPGEVSRLSYAVEILQNIFFAQSHALSLPALA